MEQKNKGGRPTKTLSEKRKYQVLLRLNTMEYYTLLGKSHEASISRTEFLRQLITNYCCPIKINRKLCISLPNGVAAALLIQGLGFQFQTVSIIKCAYFDKESL